MTLPLRLIAEIDRGWLALRKLKLGARPQVTAGAGIQGLVRLTAEDHDGIWWPNFPTLAHSFWRSQEVTLFRRKSHLFAGSVLDLGCGDGLFGVLAGFPENVTGLDYDEPSLAIRRNVLPKADSFWGDAGSMPFESERFQTIVSNSVLEHLPDLARCFQEANRVLSSGGRFCFTMTLGGFTRHLRHLTGKRDAEYWIRTFGHLQEPDAGHVIEMLKRANFDVEEAFGYQPIWASAVYRELLSPFSQRAERCMPSGVRREQISELVQRVRLSVEGCPTNDAACLWVAAKKCSQ